MTKNIFLLLLLFFFQTSEAQNNILYEETAGTSAIHKCILLETKETRSNCINNIIHRCESSNEPQSEQKCLASAFGQTKSNLLDKIIVQTQQEKEGFSEKTNPSLEENDSTTTLANETMLDHNKSTKSIYPNQISQQNTETVHSAKIANPEKDFGLDSPPNIPKHINSEIVKIKKDALGKKYIWLKNGHVWKETQSSRLKLKTGDIVRLEKGALSGYFLSKDSFKSRLKVERIK